MTVINKSPHYQVKRRSILSRNVNARHPTYASLLLSRTGFICIPLVHWASLLSSIQRCRRHLLDHTFR
ncbi:Uncharacterized protein HZ326_15322, partial [Fusarium oxysporum f. sp. albedinis]